MKLLPLFLAVFSFAGVPAVLAQGCCGPAPANQAGSGCSHASTAAGCTRDGHAPNQHQADPKPAATARAALPQSIQTVFLEYAGVQRALAEDSMEKTKTAAAVLAQSVRNDTDDLLPAEVSQQANTLAETRDLAAARAAFKSLSETLIKYAKSNGITPGAYVEVYCSMAKAGWLQTDKAIKNPYFGSSMLACGQVKS